MRFLRFTLFQAYISSIQKNKKKALFVINAGIFLSIFALSSAIISFYIEKKISDIQNDLILSQIVSRSSSKYISDLENNINTLSAQNHKEFLSMIKKRFTDEFEILNKINTTRDYYGSYIYFNLLDLKKDLSQMKKITGVDIFDKNDPYIIEIVSVVKDNWEKQMVDDFVHSLNQIDEDIKKLLKIDIEKYILQNPLTLDEIINETNNENLNSLNLQSQILDDYHLVYYAFENLATYMTQIMHYEKASKGQEDILIEEYEQKILNYSKLERNIIFSTFIFQFIIFVIIQIFEINSVNFNLKKKK